MQPKIFIIAGPNGAGKTTFAVEYLPKEIDCLTFINADLIAAGLSPFNPVIAAVRAGRLMLEEIEQCVSDQKTFAFETTLAGRSYAKRIPEWQQLGYQVKLIILSLPTVETAIQRVANRVAQGGHDIPDDVIRRRFDLGRENFRTLYEPLVDEWLEYDNSGDEPVLLKKGKRL